MDTGKIGDRQYCTPQLLAFDLRNDQLLYRHRFNQSTYNDLSLFITPVSIIIFKMGDRQYCTPQLLAFDLRNDQLLYRHRFNPSTYNDLPLFITPVSYIFLARC